MKHETGDGDVCPQDPAHGRMWMTGTKRRWCPNVRHKGRAFYAHDGVTPA